MDPSQLLRRLMVTFLDELQEHVRTLNEELLALEKEPGAAPRLQALFRAAHSLKGAAHSVNVTLIESACHALESVLAEVRDGRRPLDQELFGLLFDTADAIEEAGMRLREQQDLAGAPLETLLPRLEAATRAAPSRAPERAPLSPWEPIVRPEPPPPPAPAPDKEPSATASVRIAAEKLNTLLVRVGELLVARRRLGARLGELTALRDQVEHWTDQWLRAEKDIHALLDANGSGRQALPRRAGAVLAHAVEQWRRVDRELERLADGLAADGRLFDQVFGPLNDEVRQSRLLPFAQACEGLDRMTRDLAHASGKEVELVVQGDDVELDRSILEGIKDPLRALLRNAVDHGVEPPERRRAAGKPARARVTVAAALHGSQVEITVTDNGRGLDLEALRAQARRRGLGEPADPRDVARLVFLPGLSTAPTLTDISGRGVGLDIVKSRIEALHGTIDLSSEEGAGTRFTLTVPLTLTTMRAVLFDAGGQTYAVAGTHVRQLARPEASELRQVLGRTVVPLGGDLVPVADLASVLNPGRAPAARSGKLQLLVAVAAEQAVAFVVDELLAEQEVLIKGLGARLRRLRFVAGATQLASGRLALVLNTANLIRAALRSGHAPAPALAAEAPEAARRRLLVAEDSVTTRTLMKSILESAGFDVVTAADGALAWDLLQAEPIDLVVSDVEMPNLDGFALTELVRSSPRLRDLPVVLVTSRATEQDRLRGIQAGANSYLVKSAFDQSALLETIAQLT